MIDEASRTVQSGIFLDSRMLRVYLSFNSGSKWEFERTVRYQDASENFALICSKYCYANTNRRALSVFRIHNVQSFNYHSVEFQLFKN